MIIEQNLNKFFMNDGNKYDKVLSFINRGVVRCLMGILTLSLIGGSIDLMRIIILDVLSSPFMLIDVRALFEIFNLILIIAIGFELFKALHIVVTSNLIPSLPIIQIALIAIANKVITLDMKAINPQTMYGLAALMLVLGIAHYFVKTKRNDESKAE